ncbi:MAG: tellurium resistance protein [Tabrizicola sp.]
MAETPAQHRPKLYPPPQFPPRRAPLFATTPPAIFPPILGLLGLAAALRVGTQAWGLGAELADLADLAAGLVLPLWAFAFCTYIGKMLRRTSVILDDLKVLPSRAGLAAGTLGGLVAAGHLAIFAPGAGLVLLLAMLGAHGVLALLTLRVLIGSPPEARQVNPGWHMTFVGFILAAPVLASLGWPDVARLILYATLPIALAIWGVSLVQLARRTPPAPLRPLLVIHLAPASLFATTASLADVPTLALVFSGIAVLILVTLLAMAHWITESGFSALWGAFTFPLAATSTALMLQGGALGQLGQGILVLALGIIPWIAWRVLKQWPGGRLAAKTNAAEA